MSFPVRRALPALPALPALFLSCILAAGIWSPAVAAKKKTTVKATKTAKTVKVAPTIPLTKISLPGSKKADYCATATNVKAKFAELASKKSQLGASIPASLYKEEITVGQTLEKASPKELGVDFAVLRDYLGLFVKFSEAKDGTVKATLTTQMTSDAILSRQFDATVRVETFVRRTCGFPVGI